MEEILVPAIVFGTIFGVLYLYFSTRHKERLALIEKGASAEIFFSSKKKGYSIWKLFLLNLGLLLLAIGIGVFVAAMLVMAGIEDEIAYPGTIFMMSGIGLLTGFFLSIKMNQKQNKE